VELSATLEDTLRETIHDQREINARLREELDLATLDLNEAHAEIARLRGDGLDELIARFEDVAGCFLHPVGVEQLRGVLRRCGYEETARALEAAKTYLVASEEEGEAPFTLASAEKMLSAIATIAKNARRAAQNPEWAAVTYAVNIARKRLPDFRPRTAYKLFREAYRAGMTAERLRALAGSVPHWSRLVFDVTEFLNAQRPGTHPDSDYA